MVKKVLLLGLALLFFSSCSLDNDEPDVHFEFMPIENVVVPETFQYGEIYTIEYTYYRPSTCYFFSDLYYDAVGNTRTIAVINVVYHEDSDITCTDLDNQLEAGSFQFQVNNSNGSYTFKFWQGVNEDGEDEYLIIDVPIEN